MKKIAAILFCAALLFIACVAYLEFYGLSNQPIKSEAITVKTFIGKPHSPQPLKIRDNPDSVHPFLAPPGKNSMHNDSHQSDRYDWNGPLGKNSVVTSSMFHPVAGSCVSANEDSKGRLVGTCTSLFGVTLVARDKETLEVLARKRISYWLPVGSSFGGGVYYHVDHEDRVLLASNDPAIQLWKLEGDPSSLEWVKDQEIPLGQAMDKLQQVKHRVIDVMPDWRGNYWFITRDGLVGVSNRTGTQVEVMEIEGEGIDNALAVGRNGVFIVSNHAMYRFHVGADGKPEIVWRSEYDRGSAPKPGTMGFGSGTTPTLMANDFVAIADNADGKVNVNVYYQDPGQNKDPLFCQQPVFRENRGTSENSFSTFGNSLIIENNFGYRGPFNDITAEPGIARIDVDMENNRCVLAWENNDVSSPSAVPKVSSANGLIYLYTRDPGNDESIDAWYFTALNAHTGELVYKQLTGVGKGFNNHYGSISITSDGTAYVGVLQGVVKIRDGD